jgi:hypothetical protein
VISLVRKPRTPELDKQRTVLDEACTIGDFLDWLTGEGGGDVRLMRWIDAFREYPSGRRHPGQWIPDDRSFERLLATYFEIDLDAIAHERTALIDYLRAVQAEAAEREPVS